MHFEVNDKTTLREIQDIFSNYYPFLSLSFYKDHHKKYEASLDTDIINPDQKIGEIKKIHISTIFEVQPSYSIAQVEREFQERIGLSVQIMKKEKDKWEQTTGLDNLCLKDLNILGQNSSDEFIVQDYDEKFEKEDGI